MLLHGKRIGDPNFKTNLRYTVESLISRSRESLEAHMAYACEFGSAKVEWFEYRAIRLDVQDGYVVFEVTGRNYVPLPECGTGDQIKDALL